MRVIDWISLTVCFWIFSAMAFAHEDHQPATPTVAVAPPATGTRDAKTWFTDTPLQDQNGNTLRFYSDALHNRVVLLNVIFTSCNDACPLITQKLKEVREVLGDKADDITFISLTSDPLRDTPAVLKAYTLKQGVDGPHWFFSDRRQGANGPCTEPNRPDRADTRATLHPTDRGDVANKRWSKIRPDAPPAAIAQRLQLLTMPVAGR